MVAAANASTAGRLTHGMFMAKGAIDTGLSPKTRSLLYVGAPLENFASTTDRTAEQYDTYQEYVEKVEKKLMAHFGVSGSVVRSAYLAAAGPSGDWCGFSLPGQKRHHGGRVPPDAATPSP